MPEDHGPCQEAERVGPRPPITHLLEESGAFSESRCGNVKVELKGGNAPDSGEGIGCTPYIAQLAKETQRFLPAGMGALVLTVHGVNLAHGCQCGCHAGLV